MTNELERLMFERVQDFYGLLWSARADSAESAVTGRTRFKQGLQAGWASGYEFCALLLALDLKSAGALPLVLDPRAWEVRRGDKI